MIIVWHPGTDTLIDMSECVIAELADDAWDLHDDVGIIEILRTNYPTSVVMRGVDA